MKYWEIIADNLSRSGWSWGYCAYFQRGLKMFAVDAHRAGSDGRFIVHADDILTAFLELESECRRVIPEPRVEQLS